MTNRACWLTSVTVIWATLQGLGLLLAPAWTWQSPSYEVVRWLPDWLWSWSFLSVAGLGLTAMAAHHSGARSLSMHLSRGMAIVGGAIATAWLIGFLAALALGSLTGFSAIASWTFIVGIMLEATGMGGRRGAARDG